MSYINSIICIHQQGNAVFHLFLICVKEFIKGLHLSDIAGRDSHHLTFIHTIRKNKFQRSAHIKECGIMPPFCLTGFLRFHTSDDIVLSGILQR